MILTEQVKCKYLPRLTDNDPDRVGVGEGVLQQELRHLGRFPATSVSSYENNLAYKDDESMIGNDLGNNNNAIAKIRRQTRIQKLINEDNLEQGLS